MDAQAMIGFSVPQSDMLKLVVDASTWLAAGSVAGAFFYLTLRRSAQMLASRSSVGMVLALHLLRFTLIAGLLGSIARYYGAVPLLVATFGILAARTAVLRVGGPS
jgi:N-ATPase, AtpR subunit